MSYVYKFKAAYTRSGIGTFPSVPPVCLLVDSNNNILASGSATTRLSNLPGVYTYGYTGTAGLDLIAQFHTSDSSMDQLDLYSYTLDILQIDNTNINTIVGDMPTGTVALQSSVLAIPTNPLLANSSLLPSTKIASQADIQGITGSITAIVADLPTGTMALQSSVLAIPTNPLLANSSLLPTTVIAAKADLSGVTGSLSPSQVWGYASRTLTTPTIPTPIGTVAANTLSCIRGDSFSASIVGLGSLVNYSKLYFTVKRNALDPDSQAIFQIMLSTGAGSGLLILNGSSSVIAGDGSITINDINLGNITVQLGAAEAAQLQTPFSFYFDVQEVSAGGTVSTLMIGTFSTLSDYTLATS